MEDVYIVGDSVSLTYLGTGPHANIDVLKDISFSVQKGTICTIIGPSGCGKTTLLNCIGGLLKFLGTLSVDGKDVDTARRERYFGLVPQDSCLFEWKTVLENVLLPRQIFRETDRQSAREHQETAMGLIRLVGLADFENRYPKDLSGGMKHRASLARALSYNPRVLLMDEPFASLDALTRETLNVELLRIWSEVRNTVVFITHDISEAVFLGDRVLVMGPRSTGIKEVVQIELPRPRSRKVFGESQFIDYVQYLRSLLTVV